MPSVLYDIGCMFFWLAIYVSGVVMLSKFLEIALNDKS